MRALYTIGLGAMLAFVINAAPVQAQGTIRYVSAGGNDANACTFAAPCRTFQRAVNVVPAGGVVQVLNSAGYGNVGITKSVTISGGGNVVAMGQRIRIDNAGAVVVLRDLVMDGAGTGATGILISNAAAVHILDCEIERYTDAGIQLNGADTELFIADTVSRENYNGLSVYSDGATASLTVDNSRFENNAFTGLDMRGIESTITRSVVSGNKYGIYQGGGGTANIAWTTVADNDDIGYSVADSGSQMTLESSVVRGNGGAGDGFGDDGGLIVNPGATARISNSVFTNNETGILNYGGGTLLTRQNNTVSGNTTDTSGTLTPLAGT